MVNFQDLILSLMRIATIRKKDIVGSYFCIPVVCLGLRFDGGFSNSIFVSACEFLTISSLEVPYSTEVSKFRILFAVDSCRVGL